MAEGRYPVPVVAESRFEDHHLWRSPQLLPEERVGRL